MRAKSSIERTSSGTSIDVMILLAIGFYLVAPTVMSLK